MIEMVVLSNRTTIFYFNITTMNKYVIRDVLRIGSEHKQCEDSSLFMTFNQDDDYIYFLIAFDGCSGGVDSHFASNLMKKCFRWAFENSYLLKPESKIQSLNLEFLSKSIFKMAIQKLKEVCVILNLRSDEILSTVVYTVVRHIPIFSPNNTYYTIVSGDGSYMINDKITTIDQKNEPNYIAYHLDKSFDDIWMTFTISSGHENIDNFAVMSDGIQSYKKDFKYDNEIPLQKLLKEDKLIQSEAMLPRICNILSNDKFYHYDDLSIVRLIKLKE